MQGGWRKPFTASKYFFQQHFALTDKEKRSVTELALFASVMYVRFWCEALLPVKAPLNDLLLLKELSKYPNVTVANADSKAFSRHFWYFSEILVGLSLFNERMAADVKRKIVQNLQVTKSSKSFKRLNHPLNSAVLCLKQDARPS